MICSRFLASSIHPYCKRCFLSREAHDLALYEQRANRVTIADARRIIDSLQPDTDDELDAYDE